MRLGKKRKPSGNRRDRFMTDLIRVLTYLMGDSSLLGFVKGKEKKRKGAYKKPLVHAKT